MNGIHALIVWMGDQAWALQRQVPAGGRAEELVVGVAQPREMHRFRSCLLPNEASTLRHRSRSRSWPAGQPAYGPCIVETDNLMEEEVDLVWCG